MSTRSIKTLVSTTIDSETYDSNRVARLVDNLESYQEKVDSLSTSLGNIPQVIADVSSIQLEVNDLSANVAGLHIWLYNVQTDVSTAFVDISGIQGNIASINVQLAALPTDVIGIVSAIDSLEYDVSRIKIDVSGITANVAQSQSDIADLNYTISLLPTDIGSVITDISNLEGITHDLSAVLYPVSQQTSQNTNVLNDLSTNLYTFNANNVKLTGTQTIGGNKTFTAQTVFANSAPAFSATNASVIISGGIGIAANAYINGALNVSGNTSLNGQTYIVGNLLQAENNTTIQQFGTGTNTLKSTFITTLTVNSINGITNDKLQAVNSTLIYDLVTQGGIVPNAIGEISSTLQGLLNSLYAQGYRHFYLPRGTYIVQNITLGQGSVFYGDGKDTVLILPNSYSIIFPALQNAVFALDQPNITIKDITVNGNRDNISFVSGSTRYQYEGIALDTGANYTTLENVYVINTYNDGLDMDSVSNCIIRNCWFNNCGGHGIHLNGEGTAGYNCVNNLIDNCIIENCGLIVIDGTTFSGIHCNSQAGHNSISNVTVINCIYGGITNNGTNNNWNNIVVRSNVTTGTGILIGATAICTNIDTVIVQGGAIGIDCQGSRSVVSSVQMDTISSTCIQVSGSGNTFTNISMNSVSGSPLLVYGNNTLIDDVYMNGMAAAVEIYGSNHMLSNFALRAATKKWQIATSRSSFSNFHWIDSDATITDAYVLNFVGGASYNSFSNMNYSGNRAIYFESATTCLHNRFMNGYIASGFTSNALAITNSTYILGVNTSSGVVNLSRGTLELGPNDNLKQSGTGILDQSGSGVNALKSSLLNGNLSVKTNDIGIRLVSVPEVAGTNGQLLMKADASDNEYNTFVDARDSIIVGSKGIANTGALTLTTESNQGDLGVRITDKSVLLRAPFSIELSGNVVINGVPYKGIGNVVQDVNKIIADISSIRIDISSVKLDLSNAIADISRVKLDVASVITDVSGLKVADTQNVKITGDQDISGVKSFRQQVNARSTTDAASTTTGGLVVSGGLGVALNAHLGGNLTMAIGNIIQSSGSLIRQSGTGTNLLKTVEMTGQLDMSYNSIIDVSAITGANIVIQPSNNLVISGTQPITVFPRQPLGAAASTVNGIMMMNNAPYSAGMVIEQTAQGNILSYGINVPQVGARTNAIAGGIFRFDTRGVADTPLFSVVTYKSGQSGFAIPFQINEDGNVSVTTTGSSTSSTTGAFTVAGGVGISGELYVGGIGSFRSTAGSTSTATGAFTVTGGMGVGGNVYVGGETVIANTSAALLSSTTGALRVSGGVGVGGNIFVDNMFRFRNNVHNKQLVLWDGSANEDPSGGTNFYGFGVNSYRFRYQTDSSSSIHRFYSGTSDGIVVAGNLLLNNNNGSTSTDTGSLRVGGGAGVIGNLYVGGQAVIRNSGASLGSSTTGALLVDGGVGIGGNLFVDNMIRKKNSIFNKQFVLYDASVNEDPSGGTNFYGFGVNDFTLRYQTSTTDSVHRFFSGTGNGILVGGNLLLSTNNASISTDTGSLRVAGGVGVGGNLNIGGGANVTGNLSTDGILKTSNSLQNKKIVIYDSSANEPPTNASLFYGFGVKNLEFRYQTDVSNAVHRFYSGSTDGVLVAGNLTLLGGNSSLDASSGALVVVGGVGIGANLNVRGQTVVENILQATTSTSAALVVKGGVGVGGDIVVGGNLLISGATSFTGADISGITTFRNTSQSVDPSGGAVIIYGGLGVGKDINVRGNLTVGFSDASSVNLVLYGNTAIVQNGTSGLMNTLKATKITGNLDLSFNNILDVSGILSNGNITISSTNKVSFAGDSGVAIYTYVPPNAPITTKNALYLNELAKSGIATETSSGNALIVGINTSHLGTRTNALQGAIAKFDSRVGQPIFSIETATGGAVSTIQALKIDGSYNTFLYGNTVISNTTEATSTGTGAFQVSGGAGIAANLYVAGNVVFTNTANASSTSTGALRVSGGASINGNVYMSAPVVISDTTSTTNASTGALRITGGLSVGGNVFAENVVRVANGTNNKKLVLSDLSVNEPVSGATQFTGFGVNSDGLRYQSETTTMAHKFYSGSGDGILQAGNLTLTRNVGSTTTGTGTLIVDGGAGISGNVYVGGILNSANITESTSTATGAVIFSGGVGIAANVYVGGNIVQSANHFVQSGTSLIRQSGTGTNLLKATEMNGQLDMSYQSIIDVSGIIGTNANIVIHPLNNMVISGTNPIRVFPTQPTGSRSNTLNGIMLSTNSQYPSGIALGENGNNFYFGTNAPQLGTRTDSAPGAIFQFDTRGGANPLFQIITYKAGATAPPDTVSLQMDEDGILKVNSSAASASTASGVFQVVGGAGFGGNLYVGGNTRIANTTESTSVSSGAFAISGGVGVAANLYVGGNVRMTNTTDSTTTSTGGLVVSGGVGIALNTQLGGNLSMTAGNIIQSSGSLIRQSGTGINVLKSSEMLGQLDMSYQSIIDVSGIIGTNANIVVQPSNNLVISGTQPITLFPRQPLGADATTVNGIMMLNNAPYSAGMVLEQTAQGNILSYGINKTQVGTRDTTIRGGIVRFDTRPSAPLFSIITQKVGQPEFSAFGINDDGDAIVNSTTASTSTASGAFQVVGGVGIGGNLYLGGNARITNTTESTSVGSGAFVVSGGVGVSANLYVGGNSTVGGRLSVSSTTQSTSTSTGALAVSGGAGIGGNLYVAGNLVLNGGIDSASTSTGTLVVNGGVGISQNAYLGGHLYQNDKNIYQSGTALIIQTGTGTNTTKAIDISSSTASTSTSTGALLVRGGAGIAGNVSAMRLFIGEPSRKETQVDIQGNVAVGDKVGTYPAFGTNYPRRTLNVVDANASMKIAAYNASATPVLEMENWNATTHLNTWSMQAGADVRFQYMSGSALGTITETFRIDPSYVLVPSIRESASTTNGAFVVSGGAGIGANLFVAGNITLSSGNIVQSSTSVLSQSGTGTNTMKSVNITATTDSTTATTGAFTLAGGAGILGNVVLGNTLVVSSTNGVINSTTQGGAMCVLGGAGIAGNVYVGGLHRMVNTSDNKKVVIFDGDTTEAPATATNFYGFGQNTNTLRYQAPTGATHKFYTGSSGGNMEAASVTLTSTTGSSSITTGAIIVGGGAGIAGNAYVGGILSVSGNASFNTNATVGGNLFVGVGKQVVMTTDTRDNSFNTIVDANDSVVAGVDEASVNSGVLTLTTFSNQGDVGLRITNQSITAKAPDAFDMAALMRIQKMSENFTTTTIVSDTVTVDYSTSNSAYYVVPTSANNLTFDITNVPTGKTYSSYTLTFLLDTSTYKVYGNAIKVNGSTVVFKYGLGSAHANINDVSLAIQQVVIFFTTLTTPNVVLTSVTGYI